METFMTGRMMQNLSSPDTPSIRPAAGVENKKVFFQVLKEMNPKMIEDTEMMIGLEDQLQTFLQKTNSFTKQFSDILKELFHEGIFFLTEDGSALVEQMPEDLQEAIEMLEGLEEIEVLELVEQWLNGDVAAFPSKQDLTMENKESFAASIVGMTAILNQVTLHEEKSEKSFPFSNQQAAPWRASLASLTNMMFPGFSIDEKTNAKNIVKQLTGWLEQKSSKSDFWQQLKTGTFNETTMKNDYLGQLLERGLNGVEPPLKNIGNYSNGIPEAGTVMPKAQQMALYLGEAKTEHARNIEFIKQLQDLLGRSHLQSFKNGKQTISLKLHPEYLGRIDIKLIQQNGQIHAQLFTSTKTAREMVESQMQQLRNTFVQQNIQVERIEVQEQQSSYLKEDNQSKGGQEEGERRQGRLPEDEEEENSTHFAELLNEITFHEKV